MEYLTLNNGVKMPVAGFGTFQITDRAECERSIALAIDAEYRLIDTAQAYGNEKFVGNAIKNCGAARDELFVTTKLWFRNYEKTAAEKSLNEWLKKYGLAHQAYAPLGQGRAKEMFENEAVKEIALSHGKTPAQIALRFLVQNGISVIPKSVHTDRIKENIDIFDFALADEEMNALSELDTATPMIGNAENPETAEFAMTW